MANRRTSSAGSRLAWLAGLLLVPLLAFGGKPDHVTDAEMALLPPYCPDVYGFKYGDKYTNTSPNAPRWVAMMGNGFWAMHHYCWALINLSRINRANVPAYIQNGTRESALADMQYVIENTEPTFIILPEIYAKMGEVYLAMKNPSAAEMAYDKARSLKPNYWPAYAQWAEYLRRSGNPGKARELVEAGLVHAPESQALQRLARELATAPGGKSPRGAVASDKPRPG
jgi:tetratricopeptide (TPR) repeat protein